MLGSERVGFEIDSQMISITPRGNRDGPVFAWRTADLRKL